MYLILTVLFHLIRYIWRNSYLLTFQFDQFVVIDLQDVFNFDGLISSHPIYVPVNHPEEISAIFDRISYGKVSMIDK